MAVRAGRGSKVGRAGEVGTADRVVRGSKVGVHDVVPPLRE